MNITPTFNAAAAGPSGETGTVRNSPSPGGPHTPGAAAEASSAGVHHAEYQSTTTSEFAQSAPASPVIEPVPSPEFTLDNAAAELEMLEGGRARPAAQRNLNPPPKLKKIVDSKIERQREARISALKAYMQFKQNEAAHNARHEQREEFELNL